MTDNVGMNWTVMHKIEDLVSWFEQTYLWTNTTVTWSVDKGDDSKDGKPYVINMEWNDHENEFTVESSIQLKEGKEVFKTQIAVTVSNFAQKIWRETGCKNFVIKYKINGRRKFKQS